MTGYMCLCCLDNHYYVFTNQPKVYKRDSLCALCLLNRRFEAYRYTYVRHNTQPQIL